MWDKIKILSNVLKRFGLAKDVDALLESEGFSEDIHILFLKQGGKKDHLLSLFHHLHHSISDRKIEHEVHHCGGKHKGKDINYTISHCSHNKHRIDKEDAIGHGTTHGDDLLAVKIHFTEKCSDGGWHIESGKIKDD